MLRESVEDDVYGNNRAFQHGFIRFTGGETLHLQARPAKNAGGFAVRMSEAHEHFIAYAGNNGKHGQVEQEANEEIADRNKHIQDEEEQDADGKDNQQESRSAAGMQAGKRLSVRGSQGEAGFLAMDGFMLRTMILEGSPDFRYKTAEDHVAN